MRAQLTAPNMKFLDALEFLPKSCFFQRRRASFLYIDGKYNAMIGLKKSKKEDKIKRKKRR
jgi:hypothetical protein